MKHTENKDNNFNTFFIGELVFKNYKLFAVIILISATLSIIFSSPFFITPKFKSQVIMFPSSSNSISKALLREQVNIKQDILQYGEDEQIDQMLQVLNSTKIRDRIVDKFNLMEHYGCYKSKYKITKLQKKYAKYIKFKRTEYLAVSISVLDKDPQVAADIANYIATLYDSTCNLMQKERAIQAFKIVEKSYMSLVNSIKDMEDSLAVLRSLGVNDYETQSETVNHQLAIAIANDKQQGVRDLQKQLDILAKYGTPYVSIRDQLDYDKLQLSLIKVKYEEAKVDAEQELPQKFVISDAFPAEHKSYPIRWLIVLVSVLSAFVMTLACLLIEKEWWVMSKSTSTRVLSKEIDVDVIVKEIITEDKKKIIDSDSEKVVNNSNNKLEIKSNMSSNLSGTNLWIVLWKRRIHISIFTILGAIIGIVFSSPMFITPKFKAIAVVYPTNIVEYSEESPSEQLYQWISSTDIKWQVIKKHNLYEHYGINEDYHFSKTYILREYNKNIKISQNSYQAINVTVFDSDPQMACDIANSIIDFTNIKIRAIHKEKFTEVLDIYAKAHDWHYDESVKLAKSIGNIDKSTLSAANELMSLSNIGGKHEKPTYNGENVNPEALNSVLQLFVMNVAMNELWEKYDMAYSDYAKEFSYTSMVTTPYAADKKSLPIRWVIVILSTVALFFVSYMSFVAIDNHKFKKK